MRLRIVLPKVKPEAISVPTHCAYAGCGWRKFHVRQEVTKPLRDTVYHEVQAHRYQCLKCGRTFRVYPQGVSAAQTSLRVNRPTPPVDSCTSPNPMRLVVSRSISIARTRPRVD